MNNRRILYKYGAAGIALSVCLVLLAYFTTLWLNEQLAAPFPYGADRAQLLKSLLEHMPPAERPEALSELKQNNSLAWADSVLLLTAEGQALYPAQGKVKEPDDALRTEKVRLDGLPPQDLVIERAASSVIFRKRLYINLGVLSFALVLGVMTSILMILYFLRSRANMAIEVMSSLRHGDLKARIPLTRVDDFPMVMGLFNQMADEIEGLVNSLRRSESTRTALLRELAHDLRTPIAGLKSLVETLRERGTTIPPEKTRQILELAEREIEYFGSLVEDLLLLGSVNEPAYRAGANDFLLAEIVKEEAEAVALRFSDHRLWLETEDSSIVMQGDQKLLRRAVRNALENAFFYARKEVHVRLERDGEKARLIVEDDGPGFTQEGLVQFGKKRSSRVVMEKDYKRISIGLGSVIMKSIVESHHGTLNAENALGEAGTVTGGRLVFSVPLGSAGKSADSADLRA